MDSFFPVYNESHIQIKLPPKLIPTGPEFFSPPSCHLGTSTKAPSTTRSREPCHYFTITTSNSVSNSILFEWLLQNITRHDSCAVVMNYCKINFPSIWIASKHHKWNMHLFLNKSCNKYDINISLKYMNNTHIQLSKENAEHNFSNSFHDISDTVKSCIKCDWKRYGQLWCGMH